MSELLATRRRPRSWLSAVGTIVLAAIAFASVGASAGSAGSDEIHPWAPFAPTALTATVHPAAGVGSGQVQLSWTAPESQDSAPPFGEITFADVITNYVVEWSIGGTTWERASVGSTATSYTVGGLINDSTYTFRVAGVNYWGAGRWSNTVTATPPLFPPEAPTGLAAAVAPASGVSSGQVKLTWTDPKSDKPVWDYLIQQSPAGKGEWVTVADQFSSSNWVTVGGLVNGSAYDFRVAAFSRVGTGPWSSTVRATPAGWPDAPGQLTASSAPTPGVGSGQVRLAWTAPASTGGAAVTDYVIKVSTDGKTWTPVQDGVSATTTGFTVSGLSNGINHQFRVTAVTNPGLESANATADATPMWKPAAPIVTATIAPAAGVGSGEVKLTWTPPASNGSPIADYHIEAYREGSWMSVHNGPLPAPTYTVRQLANNVTWRFRVSAKNTVGWGPASEDVGATPVGEPTVAPGELTATVAPAPGPASGEVMLTWEAAAPSGAGVTDYVIESSTDGTTWSRMDDGVSTDTSFMVGGLSNGTPYSFRVAAANQFGAGPPSSIVQATPVWLPGTPDELLADVAPADGVGSGQVALSWAAPQSNGSAITDYVIEWSTDGDTWTTADDGTSTETASTVTGLTDGTEYVFRVAAVNALGQGQPSLQTPATPAWTAAAPDALTAMAGTGSGEVQLSWTAPASHGSAVTDYVIDRSTDGSTWTRVDDGVSTATTVIVGELTDGIEYSFRVAAVNAVGTGGWSAPIGVVPVWTPAVPEALTANAGVGSGRVQLTWSAPADHGSAITDYLVESSIDGRTWTTVDDGESTATTFTVGELTDGIEYSFRVAAVNAVGAGGWSAPIAVIPVWVPDTPAGLRTAVGMGSGHVRLTWTAPADHGSAITDYVLQRSVVGTSWTTVNDGSSTATTSTVRGLSNGRSYRFRIAAVNAVGSSAWSAAVQGKPMWKPAAPRVQRAAAGSGRVRLTWTAPTRNGAAITDYVIQRSTGQRWSTVRDGVSTSRSSTVTRLTNGVRYRFRVAAKNAVGQGAWSAVVRAIPHAR